MCRIIYCVVFYLLISIYLFFCFINSAVSSLILVMIQLQLCYSLNLNQNDIPLNFMKFIVVLLKIFLLYNERLFVCTCTCECVCLFTFSVCVFPVLMHQFVSLSSASDSLSIQAVLLFILLFALASLRFNFPSNQKKSAIRFQKKEDK